MRKKNSSWKFTLLIILLLIELGTTLCSVIGGDSSYDFLHYHLYNAFAFWEGRWYTDIIPAGIHTFFNPLLDVPLYLAVKYFNTTPLPLRIYHGLFYGLFIFFTLKIAQIIFPGRKNIWFAALATFIAVTGVATMEQLGMAFNEVTLAALLSASLYLMLAFFFTKRTVSSWFIVGSAFLAGACCGLKYTAAPFVTGLMGIFFFNFLRKPAPIKNFILFALGGIGGFLVTNGYFMYHLWVQYKNPFFPFLNEFFKSPYYEPRNFGELKFCPANWKELLLFPYSIAKESWAASEVPVAEPRFWFAYLATLPLLFFSAKKRHLQQWQLRALTSVIIFIAAFYALWLWHFCIWRYSIMLEVTSALIIVAAISLIKWKHIRIGTMVVTFCYFLFSISLPNWGRSYQDHLVSLIPQPTVKENAIVLLFTTPAAFLAPFFPPSTTFISGFNDVYKDMFFMVHLQTSRLYYAYHFEQQIAERISHHQGPIYILSRESEQFLYEPALEPFHLQVNPKECTYFSHFYYWEDLYFLCELTPIVDN